MSVAPHISAILAKWSDALNEANVSNEEAVSAAATMFGFVIINATAEASATNTEAEASAHALVDETVDEVHDFISDNYDQILRRRGVQ